MYVSRIGVRQKKLKRAYDAWSAGQFDKAKSLCQSIVVKRPDKSDAHHLLGLIARAEGNLDGAIDCVSRACRMPRARAIHFSDLSEMLRQKGRLAEAEQAGRRALTLDPRLAAAWNNLGAVLQERGNLDESLDLLHKAIASQPENAEAHNNLGNTYRLKEQWQEAEAHYSKALAINPRYAGAYSNFAALLVDLGRLDEAADYAQRAITINPRLADAYINLACVEKERKRYREALRVLDDLLATMPNYPIALALRATILNQLGCMEEALENARAAADTMPDNAEVQNSLGTALQWTGRFDEAVAAFDLVAASPAVLAESALVNKANLLIERGRKSEAVGVLQRAVEVFPRSAQAWLGYATLKTFVAGDGDIPRMEMLLGPDGVKTHRDRTALNFALGKAYLDRGDGDLAFARLNEGNRLERSTFTFDGPAAGQWMADIASAFSAETFRGPARSAAASDLPVFVIGFPRSGTTLIEQILSSHPVIHGAGELIDLRHIVAAMGAFPDAATALSEKTATDLGNEYIARIARHAGERRHVVDKLPSNFLYAGLIHLILPNARIIHCRRDPVDTCLSCYTKLFWAPQLFTYDMAELGHFHRAYQTLMEHWRAVLPPDRFLEVDYENVVADVEGQSRRMIDFLGLSWNGACVRFHENDRVVRTASASQVREPIYSTALGRWKPYARHLKPLLSALGVGMPPETA